mmetsp:Transcript_25629/g.28450  ORF Transcript_25629/g.28450 Transcript_25629/m.28450 type:complete len:81 (-) Transcript_25629:59-301(-)
MDNKEIDATDDFENVTENQSIISRIFLVIFGWIWFFISLPFVLSRNVITFILKVIIFYYFQFLSKTMMWTWKKISYFNPF